MDIRKYVVEKFDLDSQIRQYLYTMESMLYSLLEKVQSIPLDAQQTRTIEKHIEKVLSSDADYSKSSNRVRMLKDLHISNVPEIKEARGFSSVSQTLDPEIRSQLQKSDKTFIQSLKSGIKDLWSNKVKRNIAIAMSAALIITGFAFSYKALRKRSRLKSKQRMIVQEDINPAIKEIASAILKGRVRSEGQIRRYMSDLESAIYRKHFSFRLEDDV